jgi:hypothetical protein
MMNIFREVAAAAKWWADAMSAADTKQDNGDAGQSAFAALCRGGVAPLSPSEREVFEAALCDEIQRYVIRGDWDRAITEPGWASSNRTVGVDYGPDRVLSAAADAVLATITDEGQRRKNDARLSLLWPIKTHMWINPGSVMVSHGYRAERVQIYPLVEQPEAVNAVAGPVD